MNVINKTNKMENYKHIEFEWNHVIQIIFVLLCCVGTFNAKFRRNSMKSFLWVENQLNIRLTVHLNGFRWFWLYNVIFILDNVLPADSAQMSYHLISIEWIMNDSNFMWTLHIYVANGVFRVCECDYWVKACPTFHY